MLERVDCPATLFYLGMGGRDGGREGGTEGGRERGGEGGSATNENKMSLGT